MNRVVWIVLCIAASVCFGLLLWRWNLAEHYDIPIEVAVVEDRLIGFNTGTDKLYFGSLASEGAGERKMTLSVKDKRRVVMTLDGEVAPWIMVTENNFFMQPGESREIMFRMSIPQNTAARNYTGTVTLRYYRW